MDVVVVAAGDDPELQRLFALGSEAGLAMTPVEPAAAGEAVAAGAASADGCAVVGVGAAAAVAVEAAAEHGSIHGLVALGGRLDARHVELIGDWPEVPILATAHPDDRAALASAVDLYLASGHGASDLFVDRASAHEHVAGWLAARAAHTVEVSEVMFSSEDGWEIHANRRVPKRPHPVPGVVLLHTGRSDRTAYSRLERLLAEAGMAVLSIDWRGRGQSTNLGTYFELDEETKYAAWRDALAALDEIAGDNRVDAERLAFVGCVHGAEYAVRAAWRAPSTRRVRAIAILTGYRPHEPEEAELLVSGDVDVLYVTATGQTITTEAMRNLYERTPRGAAQFVGYPGSAIGYQLFEQDASLEPRIVTWLTEALT